jgi:hypothetical protein
VEEKEKARGAAPMNVRRRGGPPPQPSLSTLRRRRGLPRMHTLVTEELRENYGGEGGRKGGREGGRWRRIIICGGGGRRSPW